jgi:uncharacterized membrane protein
MWPTGRASQRGFVEFAVGALVLPAGVLMLRRAGLQYLDHAGNRPLLWTGALLLVLFGVVVFRIARRREYPWLLALAAVALPFFDPTVAPYHGAFRVLVAARDVVLVGAVVLFVAGAVRRADELERRVHLEALAWSYAAVLVLLVVQAMAADVLPPLRATWVASAMLASWVIAWLAASVRYSR